MKKIMCSGLAFEDKEDMEMLHKYALDGWIFKEFKGLYYILYKEEPQDLIFSYDIRKIKKDEKEEYEEFFIQSGWKPIKCNNNSVHFFSAKSGTVPVHTDSGIKADEFNNIVKWSALAFVISIITFFISLKLNSMIGVVLSAGIFGGSGACFLGSFLRTKRKRLALNFKFKTLIFIMFTCLIVALTIYFIPIKFNGFMNHAINLIMGLASGGFIGTSIIAAFKYRPYKDGKIE